MDVDILYHLGIDTSDLGAIKAKFGDVKVVAMGGSRGRVITFAKYAYEQLKNYYQMKEEDATTDLAKKAGRFVMYKVRFVLNTYQILTHCVGWPNPHIEPWNGVWLPFYCST